MRLLLVAVVGFLCACTTPDQTVKTPVPGVQPTGEETKKAKAETGIGVKINDDKTVNFLLKLKNISDKPFTYYYLSPAYGLGSKLEIFPKSYEQIPLDRDNGYLLRPTMWLEGPRKLPVLMPGKSVTRVVKSTHFYGDISFIRNGIFKPGRYSISYSYTMIDGEYLTSGTEFDVK